jgi:hypothetical protein
MMYGPRHNPVSLHPGKNPGPHSSGGWVEPTAGVDGYDEEKILCPHSGSRLGPSNPCRVTVLTTNSRAL